MGRWLYKYKTYHRTITDLDTAREIVKYGDLDLLEMYENPSDILSQCIRPLHSHRAKVYCIRLSAIEAR